MRLLVTAALCVVMMTAAAAAGSTKDGGPRLRPQDSRSKDVLREGMARSATFRALVERIEASTVIVYLSVNPALKPNLAGQLTWMTRAGGYRYVRASIGPDQPLNQMIATVAHELRHAIEVIDDESVTDETTLIELYRRIGHQDTTLSPNRWETVAAQETGQRVRRELTGASASAMMAKAS